MPIPCESTPGRSVRTMRPAVMSAAWRGIFMAIRVSTRKVWSLVWLTMRGTSVMTHSSEPGDPETGVLQLIAAVDGGEHRGDRLERAGVGERTHVEHPQPHGGAQVGDRSLGAGVVAADEQVTVDGAVRLGQLVRGDVVEGRHDFRPGQERLDRLGGRAGGRRRE